MLVLPPELVLQILQHVDAAEVLSVSRTCRQLRYITFDAALWKSLVFRRWQLTEKPNFESWRTLYFSVQRNLVPTMWNTTGQPAPQTEALGQHERRIGSRSLHSLIECLTSSRYPDLWLYHRFVHHFLTTMSLFTNAAVVGEKLVQRFHVPAGVPRPAADIIRLRVVHVLSVWARGHGTLYEASSASRAAIARLFALVPPHWQAPVERAVKRALGAPVVTAPAGITTTTATAPAETSTASGRVPLAQSQFHELLTALRRESCAGRASSDADGGRRWAWAFCALDVRELAQYLHGQSARLLQAVRPWHLLSPGWRACPVGAAAATHPVRDAIAFSNALSALLMAAVGCQPEREQQRAAVARVLTLAETLWSLRSYDALFAVVASLSLLARRLPQAVAVLSASDLTRLRCLQQFVSSAGNHAAYRQALNTADSDCLPFLGLVLHDLVCLQAAVRRDGAARVERIPFDLYARLADAVSRFREPVDSVRPAEHLSARVHAAVLRALEQGVDSVRLRPARTAHLPTDPSPERG